MTPPDPATAALLLRAADELELHGHMSWSLGTTDGPKCVAGALNFAHHGHPDYVASDGDAFAVSEPLPGTVADAVRVLYEHLDLGASDTYRGSKLSAVVSWNNEDERAEAEVCAALRGAASPPASAQSPTDTPEDSP